MQNVDDLFYKAKKTPENENTQTPVRVHEHQPKQPLQKQTPTGKGHGGLPKGKLLQKHASSEQTQKQPQTRSGVQHQPKQHTEGWHNARTKAKVLESDRSDEDENREARMYARQENSKERKRVPFLSLEDSDDEDTINTTTNTNTNTQQAYNNFDEETKQCPKNETGVSYSNAEDIEYKTELKQEATDQKAEQKQKTQTVVATPSKFFSLLQDAKKMLMQKESEKGIDESESD